MTLGEASKGTLSKPCVLSYSRCGAGCQVQTFGALGGLFRGGAGPEFAPPLRTVGIFDQNLSKTIAKTTFFDGNFAKTIAKTTFLKESFPTPGVDYHQSHQTHCKINICLLNLAKTIAKSTFPPTPCQNHCENIIFIVSGVGRFDVSCRCRRILSCGVGGSYASCGVGGSYVSCGLGGSPS